ncbi:50S ribosomal protein L13 [Chloroflexota bacterium]
MKTYSVKKSEIERKWHVIDASDKILGKVAEEAARLLMGKHKPMFSRHLDTGDFVVVVNATKVRFTGNKGADKMYYRHSGYPHGFKSVNLDKMMDTKPTEVITHAVKGMLPHNRLGEAMIKKLKVYAESDHPHTSQTGMKPAEVITEEAN